MTTNKADGRSGWGWKFVVNASHYQSRQLEIYGGNFISIIERSTADIMTLRLIWTIE